MSTKQNVSSKLDIVTTCAASANALVDATKGFETLNSHIAELHKSKVTIGRKGKCSGATAFYDALIARGVKTGTANNYLTTFRDAVASGTAITGWNKSREDAKGKGTKAKTKTKGKAKGNAKLVDLLLKAFNHDGGKSFRALCEKIESDYTDDKIKDVYAGFADYFESEGYEVTE